MKPRSGRSPRREGRLSFVKDGQTLWFVCSYGWRSSGSGIDKDSV